FVSVVAGRANHERLFVLCAKVGNRRRGVVQAEVDHDVGLSDDARQVVALINFADDFELWMLWCASEQGFPHASFGAGNDDFSHDCKSRESPNDEARITNDERMTKLKWFKLLFRKVI